MVGSSPKSGIKKEQKHTNRKQKLCEMQDLKRKCVKSEILLVEDGF